MYSKVLVAVDGSLCAELALQEAAKMAARGAELLVIAVADTPSLPFMAAGHGLHYDADQAAMASVGKCRILLDQSAQQLSSQGITAQMLLLDLTESRNHSVARAILDEAGAVGSDLIVIGCHGRHGLRRLLVGSVAESVIREAPCSVLLVPATAEPIFACLNPAEIYGQWPESEKLKPEA